MLLLTIGRPIRLCVHPDSFQQFDPPSTSVFDHELYDPREIPKKLDPHSVEVDFKAEEEAENSRRLAGG